MDPSVGAAFAPPEPASSEPAGEGQLALVPSAPPDPPPVAAARPAPPMLHHEPSANSAFAVEVLQGLASSEPPLATATMAPLQEMPPAPAMAQQPPTVGMPDGGAAMYGYYGASEGNPAVYGGAYHPAMYAPLGQQSAAGYPVSAMPPQYWSSMGYYLQPNQLQPNQQPVPMPQSHEPQQPPRQPRQQKVAPEATAAVPAAAGSTADARELVPRPVLPRAPAAPGAARSHTRLPSHPLPGRHAYAPLLPAPPLPLPPAAGKPACDSPRQEGKDLDRHSLASRL